MAAILFAAALAATPRFGSPRFLKESSPEFFAQNIPFPSAPLGGVVNPGKTFESPVIVDNCTARSESTTELPENSFCTDAPGMSGVAFDDCTHELFVVTDRGPNSDCDDGKGFPLPDFAPAMGVYSFNFSENKRFIENHGWYPLRGMRGTVSGRSNREGVDDTVNDENCMATNMVDPAGLDLEEVQILRTKDHGNLFIGCDEYAPKILIWNSTGHVQVAYVPENVVSDYEGVNTSDYKVIGAIPSIFSLRRKNRGFENVAAKKDGSRIITCQQSPMDAAGDRKELRASSVTRCLMLNVTDIMNPTVISQKIVLQSDVRISYTTEKRGRTSEQKDVKFSAAAWLRDDKVLLLERAKAASGFISVILRTVDFATGTDINNMAQYNSVENAAGLQLEESVIVGEELMANPDEHLRSIGVTPMTVSDHLDLQNLATGRNMDSKVEGMFIANNYTIVLVEDNDFGLESGRYSHLHVLQLGPNDAPFNIEPTLCQRPVPTPTPTPTPTEAEIIPDATPEDEASAAVSVSFFVTLACLTISLIA